MTVSGWVIAGAFLLLGLAVREAMNLHRIQHWNGLIASGRASDDPGSPAEVRFAAAYALGKQGSVQAALNAYRGLAAVPQVRLRRDALFNSATLYLVESLSQRERLDSGAELTLVELAKQSYRELLREDSGDWDARYNLERALRVAPDGEQGGEELAPPPNSHRMPTIAPGVALGLP
jgi:mxaK protein